MDEREKGLRIEKGKKEKKNRKRREEKGKKGPERRDKLRETAFLSNGKVKGRPGGFFFGLAAFETGAALGGCG